MFSLSALLVASSLFAAPLTAEAPTSTAPRSVAVQDVAVAPDRAAMAAEIEGLIAKALEDPASVGLSVAVAFGDEFIVAGGYGIAEAEHDVPPDVDTMFRIGSITKQFTAAAILRQFEKGTLGIDDLLTDHLPKYPMQGHEVSLVHLLTHTSGIKSYTDLGEEWLEVVAHELTHEELLAMFQDVPFAFAPGDAFQYCNSGYYLLGVVLEKVTGQSYAEHLQRELFAPLGLTRTRYGSNADLIKNRAQGYRLLDGELANDALIGMSQPGAAGALLSTAKDLVRWQRALVGGKVVRADSYELMTAPFVLNDGSETRYGFGLMLGKDGEHRTVGHGGGIFGFNSMLTYYPDLELSVAVISNCESYSAGALAARIARVALD